MFRVREYIKKRYYKQNYSSETFVNYLRELGVEVGEGVRFFSPRSTCVDVTRPWLVKIGNDCQISGGG